MYPPTAVAPSISLPRIDIVDNCCRPGMPLALGVSRIKDGRPPCWLSPVPSVLRRDACDVGGSVVPLWVEIEGDLRWYSVKSGHVSCGHLFLLGVSGSAALAVEADVPLVE